MASRTFINKGIALLRPNVFRSTTRGHSLSSATVMHPLEMPISKLPASKPKFTNHVKFTPGWWKDVFIVGTVFSVTGSCSLQLVQPTINSLGLNGSMKEGPWSYRMVHMTLSPPTWCAILVTLGSLFGKRPYFAAVASRVLGRFVTLGKLPLRLIKPQPKLSKV